MALNSLQCEEVQYTTMPNYSIKLLLPPITDNEFPTVSVVVPTYNRPEFFNLIMRNWEMIDYPREKLELIICDDTPKAIKPSFDDKSIRYCTLPKVPIGEKRNILCKLAKHEYIVHMDDDDWYPPESVVCRIRILLDFKNKFNKDYCFGCTKVLCLDLITCRMFEAFDPSVDGLPATISESTMAYSKKYWETQKFNNKSTITECLPFIADRTNTLCTCSSVFIITQFTHTKNTIQRRVEKNQISEDNYRRFERSLSAYDSRLFNDIRVRIVYKLPTYPEALKFFSDFRYSGDKNVFIKEYNLLTSDVKSNPLVIKLYQQIMQSKIKSSGKDVVYYCGPGDYFRFSNKWNPESKQIGGSEEAVINLSTELVKYGYNVTVYCVLEGKSDVYNGVKYRPYYKWIPGDKQDYTIIWRDPSNITIHGGINSKIFLDLHDVIKPEWLSFSSDDKVCGDKVCGDDKVLIMTKSGYHTSILTTLFTPRTLFRNIPNGIYFNNHTTPPYKIKGLMVCTSSPDRCLRALLRALPLIRKEVKHAQIYWAYGFTSSINDNGGMEKDPRTKEWVEESKKLIKNTEGFTDLGRLSQTEVVELYKKADLFIYPTYFPEIDCISLSKALLYGCIPVCTPSGAISEKLNISEQIAKKYLTNGQFDYSLEDDSRFDTFVKEVIKTLKTDYSDEYRKKLSNDANNKYNWSNIVKNWMDYM